MKIKIEIEIQGKTIQLTPEEAKELHAVLSGFVGNDSRYQFWYQPYQTPFLPNPFPNQTSTVFGTPVSGLG